MSFAPGDTFDRYRIDAVLGEGGMARVYRAYDTRLRRNVALKVLLPTPTAETRILREARAAAALSHPNAVSVYDVGEVDGNVYLAMEFISGKTLRTHIAEGRAPWETRVRWLVEIARAISAAHAKGLIHRDIKPENVIVRNDGVVKVLDFGIAKRVDLTFGTSDDSRASSADGSVVGTPRYMSPEQVRGEDLDVRTDQFSWGVVAFETLTGKLPWGTLDGVQLLVDIMGTTPPSLETLVPNLPAIVAATVARALAKTPEGRFDDMAAVATGLDAFGKVSAAQGASAGALEEAETAENDMGEVRRITQPTANLTGASMLRVARARRQKWAFAAGLVLVIGLALVVSRWPAKPEVAPPPPPPMPTAVTAAAPPTHGKPEALAAYAAGLQSFRDAAFEAARQSFEQATTLDPTLGAAHLRLAILDLELASDEMVARHIYGSAVQFRSTMSPRDAELLDAFDTRFRRDPPDFMKTEERLLKVVEHYPLDAEVAFYLGFMRIEQGRFPLAREALERSVELDPKFGEAYSHLAMTNSFIGDFPRAAKEIARCLEVSPGATDCLWNRAMLHEQSGECAALERDVREWVARAPEDYYGYQMLGKALLSQHATPATVFAALEQKWSQLPADSRKRLELSDRVRMAIYMGEFGKAEGYARALDTEIATNPAMQAHAEPLQYLSEIYEETGRLDRVREVARTFLERKGGWVSPVDSSDYSVAVDPTPNMLGQLSAQGALSPMAFKSGRDEWIAGWKKRTTAAFVHHLWIYGFARPALSQATAKQAMDALPEYLPLPPFTPQTVASYFIGRTYFLAGYTNDAIPYLERATKTCTEYNAPFDHTRAYYYLGLALADAGRVEDACHALARVAERWGKATPPSVTAGLAKARSSKLGCAKVLKAVP